MKSVSAIVMTLLLAAQVEANVFPKNNREMNADAKKVLYYGGPVISHAKIYTVFWGAKIDPKIKAAMPAFYASLVNSSYMDWLSEYATNGNAVDGRVGTNQTIGRGSYGTTITITPSAQVMAASKTGVLADAQIQAELEKQILAGVLPTPTADTLYMIHFPNGLKVSIDDGNGGIGTSCQQFCAFHEGFKTKAGLSVFYGVIPDLSSASCSMGCGMGKPVLDITTISASHEVIEAVTDAFPTPGTKPGFPQAWNTLGGEEIGDLCQATTGKLNASGKIYTIQQEYDNAKGTCTTGDYIAQ